VWYSLTLLPFEANRLAAHATMEPHLFFFPNASFYGGHGITIGLILNHAIWLLGLVTGVVRFFTPFVTTAGDKKRVLAEWLISGTFLLCVAGYVQFFPLKHAQYLIPIAIFIAYYAADGLSYLLERWGSVTGGVMLGVIVYLFIIATWQVQSVKMQWGNATQLIHTATLVSTIPPTTPVMDLEGRMMFWPDAYHICCVPFGFFEQYLSRKPESLRNVLEAHHVLYVWQGDTKRIEMLSLEDQAYIRAAYKPVPLWTEALWKRIDSQ
jgi:hypothetical protein